MILKRVRKEILETRRAELAHRMHETEGELLSHQSKDWEDLATEREGDEVLERMHLSDEKEIRAIDAALLRMRRGQYGICVKCGSEISAARLDLLPATPFCKACA